MAIAGNAISYTPRSCQSSNSPLLVALPPRLESLVGSVAGRPGQQPPTIMAKIAALKGLARKHAAEQAQARKAKKRSFAWVDVSDDDMHVKSAGKHRHKPTKEFSSPGPHSENEPRKKRRFSAPGKPSAHSTAAQSIQAQRAALPIATGQCVGRRPEWYIR